MQNKAKKNLPEKENRLRAILGLFRIPERTFEDMAGYIIEECIKMSGSELGFIGFINEDETLLKAHLWSKKAMKSCAMDYKPAVFSLKEAGIWAEPIRQHQPFIINDYKKPNPLKKGYPEGHVPLSRLMGIPIIEEGRAVSLLMLANKKQNYTKEDALHVNLFLESAWVIIKRKLAEDALREAHREMEDRVEERTRDLKKANESLEREISERIHIEDSLRKSESLFRKVLEALPVGVWVLDQDGKVLSGNLAGQEIWCGIRYVDMDNYCEYKGRWVSTGEPVKPHDWAGAKAILKGKSSFNDEVEIECFDGTKKIILNSAVPMINEKGDITGAIVVNQDITERKKMEEAARESAVLYSQFFRSSVAGTFRSLYDPSKKNFQRIDCNDAFAKILGYGSREELLMHPMDSAFISNSDLSTYTADLLEKEVLTNYQLFLKRKEGGKICVLLNANLRDYANGIMLVEGTMADITERVTAEQNTLANIELLRSLTSELVMTEERERRRIAVDLHDNIGQTLAMSKIKLDSLLEQAAGYGLTRPVLEIAGMVDQSIQQTRSLMTDLSPSVLYELGFANAIEWLCEQMQEQYGLRVFLKNDLTIRRIDDEVQILLFRATKELLMNIVKHAGAKEAHITLQKSGNNIKVTVRDDGPGFDVPEIGRPPEKAGGFGLVSIYERIKYLGGVFEVNANDGSGASITLTAPQKIKKKKSGVGKK
jgi:PAS domain S-box-containing protein